MTALWPTLPLNSILNKKLYVQNDATAFQLSYKCLICFQILFIVNYHITARKTIFSFSIRPEKIDGLSGKIEPEFDLSSITGKYDFSFSRKYDLTPGRKMKDDLSQKNTRKYKDMIFPVPSEKVVFFPENIVFFPWTENKGRMTFLKKYTETKYFLFQFRKTHRFPLI